MKLEDDILLLQLNIKGERNRQIVTLKRFSYDDLPEKIKAFGDIKEVYEYFQNAENFEINTQSAAVTVFVFVLIKHRPVQESVILPLEKQKVEIDAEILLDEIYILEEKI